MLSGLASRYGSMRVRERGRGRGCITLTYGGRREREESWRILFFYSIPTCLTITYLSLFKENNLCFSKETKRPTHFKRILTMLIATYRECNKLNYMTDYCNCCQSISSPPSCSSSLSSSLVDEISGEIIQNLPCWMYHHNCTMIVLLCTRLFVQV